MRVACPTSCSGLTLIGLKVMDPVLVLMFSDSSVWASPNRRPKDRETMMVPGALHKVMLVHNAEISPRSSRANQVLGLMLLIPSLAAAVESRHHSGGTSHWIEHVCRSLRAEKVPRIEDAEAPSTSCLCRNSLTTSRDTVCWCCD